MEMRFIFKMQFLAFIFVPILVYAKTRVDLCNQHTLAVYMIRMETHWSKELFPKQYPTFRPPAQFSRLLGMVHNASYVLWREDERARPEIRTIAEEGSGELLEQKTGVRDTFAAPAVTRGVGSTETIFYSDGKHTLVSVISKIVPSPDWFVGLDSYDLCLDGRWINNVTIRGGPFDAGTDDGFTFTAPNWATEPSTPVTPITAQEPSHPANSFYYPNLKELPPLVTFHISKERVYRATDKVRGSKHKQGKFANSEPVVVTLPNNFANDSLGEFPHEKRKRLRRKYPRRPAECVVSTWSSWSSCSSSCGVGFETRSRSLVGKSRRTGTCKKELRQKRWCGDRSRCLDKYFNW